MSKITVYIPDKPKSRRELNPGDIFVYTEEDSMYEGAVYILIKCHDSGKYVLYNMESAGVWHTPTECINNVFGGSDKNFIYVPRVELTLKF